MTEKRTYEDVEADVKASRDEIAGFEDQQFKTHAFREEVNDELVGYNLAMQNWSQLMPNSQETNSLYEDVYETGKYVQGQGDLLVEDSLNSISAKIENCNQKIETYGAELKQLREEDE